MTISCKELATALEISEKRIKEHMDLTVKPIIQAQKEHHRNLYDPIFGLNKRIQKIENYSTATLIGVGLIAGVIGGIVSFKDRISSWFS